MSRRLRGRAERARSMTLNRPLFWETCMKAFLMIGTASVLAVAMNAAIAQQKTTLADAGNAAPASELDEVIVTGTRRLDRTVAESSAPMSQMRKFA